MAPSHYFMLMLKATIRQDVLRRNRTETLHVLRAKCQVVTKIYRALKLCKSRHLSQVEQCSRKPDMLVQIPLEIDRLLSPDIVQFRSACLRTEIFLRELTLSSTLSSNPKSSHSVDPQFSHKLLFFTKFTTNFFIVQRHGWMHPRLHNSKWLIRVNQSPHLTNDRFA